jgi:hypothetical protein
MRKPYIKCIIGYTLIHFAVLNMATKAKSAISGTEQLLSRIVDGLNHVNKKLDSIIQLNENILRVHKDLLKKCSSQGPSVTERKISPDALSLLSLPAALRKTVMVLYKIEKATAEGLAKETGRLRAVESAAANQLVRLGYLKKRREGREVYFYIESPMEIEK